ncbi:MAG: molecular chaperone DnaJ [Parahaliea sp.]
MSRLILVLAIGAFIYILFQRINRMPPHKHRAEYIKLGLTILVVVVAILTLTGRMHWIGAAFAALLVILRQLAPLATHLLSARSALKNGSSDTASSQHSTVETHLLRMQLDHNNGKLSGTVINGPFKDWHLAEMDRPQLWALMQYCQHNDDDSLQLLQAYLNQRFPDEPLDEKSRQNANANTRSGMNRQEALAVLGLTGNPTEDEIINAHRLLMQKLHPDRGGSDYLAAKINAAKDFLLN